MVGIFPVLTTALHNVAILGRSVPLISAIPIGHSTLTPRIRGALPLGFLLTLALMSSLALSSSRFWATSQEVDRAGRVRLEFSITLAGLGYRTVESGDELPANPQPAGPVCFLDNGLIAI